MTRSTAKERRGDPRISPTAYATAAAWARYGFAEAEVFDSRRGRAMLAALGLGTRVLSPVAPVLAPGPVFLRWRHQVFSRWVEAQAPELAIEIGAGLSTRGQAHARAHPEMLWHDLDLPGMVTARQRRQDAQARPPNHRLAVGDLFDSRLGADIAAPRRGPVVALTEGVVDYLDRDAKRHAWSNLATLLRRLGGGRYLAEIHPLRRFCERGPTTRLARALTARPRATLCYHESEMIPLLKDAGFARARALSEPEAAELAGVPDAQPLPFCLLEAEI